MCQSGREGSGWREQVEVFLLKVTWECWILSMFAERSFTASLLSERGRRQSFIFSVLVSPWHVKLSINIGRAGQSFAGSKIPRFHADYFSDFSLFHIELPSFLLVLYIAKCLVTKTPQQWSPVDFLFAKQITSLSGKCTLCMQVTLSHLAITNDGCKTKAKYITLYFVLISHFPSVGAWFRML